MGKTHRGERHREQIIELHSQKLCDREIASRLGLGEWTVHDYRRRVLQLPRWSRYELIKAVRSDCSVNEHGDTVRALHAEGYSDAEIAAQIGVKREAVGYYRRVHLAIAAKPRSQQKNRDQARRSQERSMGCTPADVRSERLWAYATDRGWPAGLRKRSAQILDLLFACGPLTRQQIAERLQLSLKGLNGNDPQGSYLANLISRGLVASVARAVDTGRVCRDGRTRKGTQVSLYFPTPDAIAMQLAWRRSQASQESPT